MRTDFEQRVHPLEPKFNNESMATSAMPQKSDDVDFLSVLSESNKVAKERNKEKPLNDMSKFKSYEDFVGAINRKKQEENAPKSDLGKNDFLKLFVTQLKQQDPLNPKDGAEMAAQLAQFNGLEQMMNINTGIEKLGTAYKEQTTNNMVNFLGKEVKANVHSAQFDKGLKAPLEYNIPSGGKAEVVVEVYNQQEKLVTKLNLGPKQAGTHQIAWDGKIANSDTVSPPGLYSFTVKGLDMNGTEEKIAVSGRGTVTGFDLNKEKAPLKTTIGPLALADIEALGLKEEPAKTPVAVDPVMPKIEMPPQALIDAALAQAQKKVDKE